MQATDPNIYFCDGYVVRVTPARANTWEYIIEVEATEELVTYGSNFPTEAAAQLASRRMLARYTSTGDRTWPTV